MHKRALYIPLTALFLMASIDAHAIPAFTDWATVDASADSASGTLNGIAVSLTGYDIFAGSVTDGTSPRFSDAACFTPALALGDFVAITGSFATTFTYTVTFSSPVMNPIMHVASLASTLHFPGIALTKVSGEANFVVSGSDVIGGLNDFYPTCGNNDRNGTILLNGTFTSFSFTANALGRFTGDRDGIVVQIGADVPTVGIDIKPGSFPNCINLGSKGTVPVAILSTSTFDATTVDPTTVTLASAPVQLKGKRTPMAAAEDVNGDGFPDLVVHVSTEALQVSENDESAVLEGQTFDGMLITGTDSVCVVH